MMYLFAGKAESFLTEGTTNFVFVNNTMKEDFSLPIRNMIITGLFSALLAVSSQIFIPGPVPHTLQTFVVLLTGVILGPRWGAASIIVWILLGVFGLPVFAQGKVGIAVLAGPTGGFLLGFILCAWLTGSIIIKRELSYLGMLSIMLTGLAVIYAVGLVGFMASFAWFLHKPMTWEQAAAVSVLPFLPFDIVKAAAAAYLGVRLRRTLHKAGLSFTQ